MNKKIIAITLIAIVLITAISTLAYRKSNYIGTELEPINQLVKIQHFNKGTYEDFKELFTNPKEAINIDAFEANRKQNKLEDTFEHGAKNTSEVMKHMKFMEEKDNKDLGRVYYLKDVNDTKKIERLSYWMVENKEGKWLIKND